MLLLLGVLTVPPALAQQTIFNVPSADTTPLGEVFLQHESQFRPWPDTFSNQTEYLAVGLSPHTELDLTLFNLNTPKTTHLTLVVGVKTRLILHPKNSLQLTVGQLLPISLQGRGVGNWSYAHLSGRVPKLNTRLTAGVNTGTRQIFDRTVVCFIGGIEHPLTERITLLADWYSGNHALGLLIAGVSVALPKNTGLYLGFQVPNHRPSAQEGFVVELSKRF
jgi:hypothetical protein